MQHVLPDKLSVTAIFLVLGSVPDYCIFYIYIYILRLQGIQGRISLFVLPFGLCMTLVRCCSRPGRKCRSHSVCVLASIQGIEAVSPDV